MPDLSVLPARVTIPSDEIGGRQLIFEMDYNGFEDFVTLAIWKPPANDETRDLIYRGKLQYGQDFLSNQQHRHPDISGLSIVPFDMSMREKSITRFNFGNSVLLYFRFNPLYRQEKA